MEERPFSPAVLIWGCPGRHVCRPILLLPLTLLPQLVSREDHGPDKTGKDP